MKLKKSIVNLLFRKAGLLVRIYGENANNPYIKSFVENEIWERMAV